MPVGRATRAEQVGEGESYINLQKGEGEKHNLRGIVEFFLRWRKAGWQGEVDVDPARCTSMADFLFKLWFTIGDSAMQRQGNGSLSHQGDGSAKA